MRSRLKDFKWLYHDRLFNKSQSQPSKRSTASFSLAHSWERIAPPLSPIPLCKYHCHHNALQLCVNVMWALSMPNPCGSVWLWGHDYGHTGRQKHPKRKSLFCNLTLKNKGGGGSNSKYRLHLYLPSSLLPNSYPTAPEPLTHHTPLFLLPNLNHHVSFTSYLFSLSELPLIRST